jgi:hypothetical protein
MSRANPPLGIVEILKRIKSCIASKKDKDCAEALGVATSTLHNWKKRNTIPIQELYSFSIDKSISLDWLLTGRRDTVSSDKENNIVALKHMDLVKNFADQKTAFNINKNLQVIEKFDTNEFKRINIEVEGIASYLTRSRGGTENVENRRKGERRSDVGKSYNGDEHRSGKDRRKVG